MAQLKLRVDGEWPADALHFISILVDLPNLQTLSFQSDFNQPTVSKTVDKLVKLVHLTSNIRSLVILPLATDGQYTIDMLTLCSIVPFHVKHLTLKIQKPNDMKTVIEKLKHLLSVSFRFPYDRKIHVNEMIDWLVSNGRDLTHLEDDDSLRIWLGNN